MPEAVTAVASIDSAVNMNSTSFATRSTISASDLGTAGFSINEDVIVVFWAILSQANLGSEQVWRLQYNGSTITNGTANPRLDCASFANTGQNVGFIARVNLGGTLGDFTFQNQRQGTSANVTVQKSRMFIIRAADLGTEGVDWFWNQSTTNVVHTTSYSATNRATITWTPASATDDWLVLASTHIAIDQTANNAEARLMLDGSTLVAGDWSIEGVSTSEEMCSWMVGVMENLAASSHTLTVETRDDGGTTLNDHRQSNILLIRAGRFPDLFWHVNSNVNTNEDTRVQVATVTSTVSANQNALILGNVRHDLASIETDCWLDVEMSNSTIDPNTAPNGTFNNFTVCTGIVRDATDELNIMWMTRQALTAGAQDIDMNASATDNTVAISPRLIVWGLMLPDDEEPEFDNEAGTEEDVAGELALTVEPLFSVQAATEEDTAQDVVMAAEPVFTVEAATEEDVAGEVDMAVDTGMSAEEATEEDTAEDTVMVTEPVLTVESASEVDTAHDVVLQTAPAFDVEAASEEDTAHDVALTVAEVFTVEAASEVDEAHDVVLAVEQVFTVEPASEEDHAEDVSVGAAVGMEVEPASEEDLAEDILLQAEPLLDVEPATEEDTAHDVVLAVEPVFVVEHAEEEDRASDVDMASVSGFGVEQAFERDQAHEVVLAVEPVFVVEPASEEDTAHEAVMAVEQEFEVEAASEEDHAFDVEMGAVVGINVEAASEVDVAHDVVMVTDLVFPVEPATEVDHAHDVIFVSVVVFVVEPGVEVDRAFDVVMDNSDVIVLASPVCGIEGPHGVVGLVTIGVRHDVTGPEAAGSLTGPGGAAASIGPASTCGIDD